MKDLFKGYIKKSEEDIEKLWNKAIFVFDTNVLLNLYRYSEDTRNSILDLIKNFSDRIYLPHQAAFEFSKNRYEVISDQEKIFNDFSKKLKEIEKEINSKLQHPFLSEKLNKEIQKVFAKVETEVESNKETFNNLSKKDPIFDQVCVLFKNRISNKYSEKELEEICKEGEKRYTKKIPPGFEDNSKVENKFGDLIIWFQIIDIAKSNPEKGIIFISDEKKKDWWWELKDKKTVGPRPELINEMFEKSKAEFHIFSSERFLQLGSKYSNITPSPEAINEIETFKKKFDDGIKKLDKFFFANAFEDESYYIKNDIQKRFNNGLTLLSSLIKEANILNERIHELQIHRSELDKADAPREVLLDLDNQTKDLEKSRLDLRKRVDDVNDNLSILQNQLNDFRKFQSDADNLGTSIKFL